MNASNVTPAQRDAIDSDQPLIVCVAGPGSGKSSTLIARIRRLMARFPEKGFAAISFTNAASRILQEKLGIGIEKGDGKTHEATLGANSTLHAFALRCLKRYGAEFGYGDRTAMIAPDAAADLMTAKATSLGCKTPIEKLLKLKAEKGRPPRGTRLSLDETVVATYLDELKEARVVDYDGILHNFFAILTDFSPGAKSAQLRISEEFTHLFVDEIQDSNPIQWGIFHALPIANKFFVGDPDQNLYSWNGARLKEMLDECANPFAKLIKLEANFRSDVDVCTAAQRLIERNDDRVDKLTEPVSTMRGTAVFLGEYENAGEEIAAVSAKIREIERAGTPFHEIAILSRTNAIAAGFRRQLPAVGIPITESKRHELPSDWAYARSLVEVHISPDNDSLAYFYLVARGVNRGMPPAEARAAAQRIRVVANSKGRTINEDLLALEPITRAESALAILVGAGVSREAHMIAVEKWRDLPSGASLEDFTVALAQVADFTKPGDGLGVQISTIHGWKGREADAVFLVGVEDEVFPGMDAREGAEGIEAARRCLYVGITRARHQLYFSASKSRPSFGSKMATHKPSRFLPELGLHNYA